MQTTRAPAARDFGGHRGATHRACCAFGHKRSRTARRSWRIHSLTWPAFRLPRRAFVIVVAQQSESGKFNRGALLSVGFREAHRLGAIASVVFDVDRPVGGLLPALLARRLPAASACAGRRWRVVKYDLAGYADAFLGGVVAFHPDDFARCNGLQRCGAGVSRTTSWLRGRGQGARRARAARRCRPLCDLDELALPAR